MYTRHHSFSTPGWMNLRMLKSWMTIRNLKWRFLFIFLVQIFPKTFHKFKRRLSFFSTKKVLSLATSIARVQLDDPTDTFHTNSAFLLRFDCQRIPTNSSSDLDPEEQFSVIQVSSSLSLCLSCTTGHIFVHSFLYISGHTIPQNYKFLGGFSNERKKTQQKLLCKRWKTQIKSYNEYAIHHK